MFRAKARWTEYREKPTKYLFNMKRRNYNRKVTTELKGSNGRTVTDAKEIMCEIQNFYDELYKSSVGGNINSFEAFYDMNFPKLSDEEKNELEGMITIKEVIEVLKNLKNGKSPGDGGFTVDFYIQFFGLLGQDLVDSLNASYESGEMSVSQRRGVITLIPKEEANLQVISG